MQKFSLCLVLIDMGDDLGEAALMIYILYASRVMNNPLQRPANRGTAVEAAPSQRMDGFTGDPLLAQYAAEKAARAAGAASGRLLQAGRGSDLAWLYNHIAVALEGQLKDLAVPGAENPFEA